MGERGGGIALSPLNTLSGGGRKVTVKRGLLKT